MLLSLLSLLLIRSSWKSYRFITDVSLDNEDAIKLWKSPVSIL